MTGQRTVAEILAEINMLTHLDKNSALTDLDHAGIGMACNALLWSLGGASAQPVSDLVMPPRQKEKL